MGFFSSKFKKIRGQEDTNGHPGREPPVLMPDWEKPPDPLLHPNGRTVTGYGWIIKTKMSFGPSRGPKPPARPPPLLRHTPAATVAAITIAAGAAGTMRVVDARVAVVVAAGACPVGVAAVR